ncbi:MAG: flavodoxin [Planctomycetia bacterium]|nr:flavodoxin [Planctomycetia bacterium]
MSQIKVIYGSTTGATEAAAKEIAEKLGATLLNVADASPSDFDADLLVLGSSTWGIGDLQDDWATAIDLLNALDFSGKKAAVFGMGDQFGFGDSYVDAMGILAETLKERGAELVGATSAEGYSHSASRAEQDGIFCGLALDDTNESEKTSDRIDKWVEELKNSL